MTRAIVSDRTGPYVVKKSEVDSDTFFLCACGLSATKPFCDNSHKKTRSETPGVLYYYPENDDANEPRILDPAVIAEPADEG